MDEVLSQLHILSKIEDLKTSILVSKYILENSILYRNNRSFIFNHIYSIQSFQADIVYQSYVNEFSPKDQSFQTHQLFILMTAYSRSILDLFYEFGYHFEHSFFEIAIHLNNLDALRWAKEKDIFFLLPDLFVLACKKGYIEIVKWLYENGTYEWSTNKTLTCLESKIPPVYLEKAMFMACLNEHKKLVEYLCKHTMYDPETIEKVVFRKPRKRRDTLQIVNREERSFLLDNAFLSSIEDTKTHYYKRMIRAISLGRLDTLQSLYYIYPKLHPHELLWNALKFNYEYMDVIEFLLSKYPIDISSIKENVQNHKNKAYIFKGGMTSIAEALVSVYEESLNRDTFKLLNWLCISDVFGVIMRPIMINTRKHQFYKAIYTQNINRIKSLYHMAIKPTDTINLYPDYFHMTSPTIIKWIIDAFGPNRIINRESLDKHVYTEQQLISIFIRFNHIEVLKHLSHKSLWKKILISELKVETHLDILYYHITRHGTNKEDFIWLYHHSDIRRVDNLFDVLILQGNREVLNWLYKHNDIRCSMAVFYLGKSPNILEWVKKHVHNIKPISEEEANLAIENITLPILIWLLDHHISLPKSFKLSKIDNDLKLVKTLHCYFDVEFSPHLLPMAALQGNLPLVKYLYKEVKLNYDKKSLSKLACRANHFHIVKYLEA